MSPEMESQLFRVCDGLKFNGPCIVDKKKESFRPFSWCLAEP